MKEFGVRTAGLEYIFETTIFNYIFKNKSEENFTFLEIGSAGCVSLKSFYETIKETISHDNWGVRGLDLCKGWSLDWGQINSFEDLTVYTEEECTKEGSKKAILNLTNKPREWIAETFEESSIDICFIDGCHGLNCVVADFNTVEPKIKSGGIVMFHDSGIEERNFDVQPCCQTPIRVRDAIVTLGLFGQNPKWEPLADVIGGRVHAHDFFPSIFIAIAPSSDGNGVFITRKK